MILPLLVFPGLTILRGTRLSKQGEERLLEQEPGRVL
jgi:hypothetical protein